MTAKILGLNLLALTALILVGCSTTSAPTRYFQLEPVAQQSVASSPTSKLLAVGPLHLPDYLDRPQLVTRSGTVELSIDDFERWAEPLESALPRVIAANLGGMRDDLAALDHRHDSYLKFDYRLLGNINRFDVDESGQVVLVVRWWLQDAQGEALISNTAGRYQVAVQDPGSTASSVEAMNRALELFSRDIAQALDEANQQI